MNLYSKDNELDIFTQKAYELLLKNKIRIEPESFKEIAYGVSFKAEENGKEFSVAIYHSPKKGFSIVTKSERIQAIINSLLFTEELAGSDEAGKGDIFGPLVVSSFFLGNENQKILGLGIKDSKNMKNEDILKFYKEVTMEYADSFSTVKIMPEKYNTLYENFKKNGQNLNNLVAWAHGKALFNLIQKKPMIKKIIVDQFSADENIKNNIKKMVPSADVIFETKGEKHFAVAAASIMAKGEYLFSLAKISSEILQNKVNLVSGSGEQSDNILKFIVKEFGIEILPKICKCHFANISKIKV